MIAKFSPSKAVGTITAPPSKSFAHRALICGALSQKSVISNISLSKDIEATLNCLKALGAKVIVEGDKITIGGLDPFNLPDNISAFCNESGSTLRFLIPICMLSKNNIRLCGSKRLFERPLDIYKNISEENNIYFDVNSDFVDIGGKLQSGCYNIKGNISSQFITGLLFTLPLLEGDSEIRVTGAFESESYVNITLSVLKDFGIKIDRKDNIFYIKGSQNYKSTNYTVEGDCSNAAFLEAFNYIGGKVAVKNLNENSIQGDRVYSEIFKQMKQNVKEFDLSDCPDLAPIVFALGAALGGDFTFTGTARLKIKESDRATAMQKELAKFGAETVIGENSFYIKKCKLTQPKEPLFSHNDHRIVMALSVLCSLFGGEIEEAEAINKSFPDFFEKIKSLGIGLVLE